VPVEPKAIPLQVGDIVHKLLHMWYTNTLTADKIEHLDTFVQELYSTNSDEQTLAVAVEAANLFMGYYNKFGKTDPLHFISSEIHVQKEFDNYVLLAKVDALARPSDGRLWRVEHKTTSRLDSAYLNGLKGGLQGAIYDYLIETVMNEKVSGTIYNLLVKTKVPDYHRAYSAINRPAIARALETVDGVYRDICRGDFYPSSLCFTFNRECDYRLLCNQDTPSVREKFYKQKEEPKNGETDSKEGESS
jgi:hypothetical protein